MSSDVSSKPAVAVTTAMLRAKIALPPTAEEVTPMQRVLRGRFAAEQGNLFHPQRERPAWMALPLETRKEVARLVAQMLKRHQADHAFTDVEVVRHD